MGRGTRDRAGHRGGEGIPGHGGRGSDGERWDPGNPDYDPARDLTDMYDDLSDPVNDEYVWPEHEDPDED